MQVLPQITPWNVWDLPLHLWWTFARMSDDWVAEMERRRHG